MFNPQEGMFNNLSEMTEICNKMLNFATKLLTRQEMNASFDPQHPYIRMQKEIREKGVVVIDDIPAPPAVGEAYISGDLLIIVCHQGAILNDNVPEHRLRAHDVSVLMPDQIVMPVSVTPDLRCTNVAVSRQFYERLRHQYTYTRCASHFRRRPPCLLTEEQFQSVLAAVNLIRTVSLAESLHRQDQLAHLLCILISMLGEYHVANYPDEQAGSDSLSSRFYELLIRHHRESREMAFYARECCLSPKHFSEVIKRETGQSPSQWISTCVTIRAKSLLDSRKDYTVQQISHYLGFTEQASFTRFFKRETGLTPSEYRER